ncbi:MAG: hypothetical protein M1822_005648 [Bathelium mastoideum]|nr:MAG: hypothetical protein M1822_005648 [Bathelium mastoideum]
MEDQCPRFNPRDSIGSSQSESESSFSWARTDSLHVKSSDPIPSIESDILADSVVATPQSYNSSISSRQEAEIEKHNLPTLIVLNPQGPLKTPSIKRIIHHTGKPAAPDPNASSTETQSRQSSRCKASISSVRNAFCSTDIEDDDEYIIRTDTPANFPYTVHAYPLKDPGSEEEPVASPTYAPFVRGMVVPVVTIVRQGGRERFVKASTEPERQGISLSGFGDIKAKQAAIVDRYCIWEKMPPVCDGG